MKKETIEIGDKIKITNPFGGFYTTEIVRVTKTKAISKPYNPNGAINEFKRDCCGGIKLFKRTKWSQTEYNFV